MTRHCTEIELLITQFAADELPADQAADVAGHVAVCEPCRDELNLEITLRRSLAALPVVAAPAMATPLPGSATAGKGRRVFRGQLVGGLLAAVLALAVLMPDLDNDLPDRMIASPYTPAQVSQARVDLRTSLTMALDIITKTERHTMADVFGRQLPRAVSGSLSGAVASPEGGQG